MGDDKRKISTRANRRTNILELLRSLQAMKALAIDTSNYVMGVALLRKRTCIRGNRNKFKKKSFCSFNAGD